MTEYDMNNSIWHDETRNLVHFRNFSHSHRSTGKALNNFRFHPVDQKWHIGVEYDYNHPV